MPRDRKEPSSARLPIDSTSKRLTVAPTRFLLPRLSSAGFLLSWLSSATRFLLSWLSSASGFLLSRLSSPTRLLLAFVGRILLVIWHVESSFRAHGSAKREPNLSYRWLSKLQETLSSSASDSSAALDARRCLVLYY